MKLFGADHLKNGIKRISSGTALVTIALLIGGFFAYILQLFLGRHLSVEDYGTFNALLSLFNIFSVPVSVLGVSIVKIASELTGSNKKEELSALFVGLCKRLLIWTSPIIILLFAFRFVLADQLNIDQPLLFLSLGIYLYISFILVPPQAYLRGLLMFNRFALYSVVSGFLRLAAPVGIVYLGYRVGGVYTGMSLSMIFSFAFAAYLLKDNFVKSKDTDLKPLLSKILKFSLPALLTNLGLIALVNMDIVLVKKYFSPLEAGYYSGVVTLGKIILFGTGSVVVVMFPEMSALKTAGKNYIKRLKIFLLFQLTLLAPAVIVFSVFPKLITLIFFGEQFLNSVEYLPLFSIFISLYVLASFMVNFFLAIDKTKVYLLFAIPVITQFILLNSMHSDLFQVIKINIVSTSVLLVSLGVYLYKVNYDRIHNRTGIQSS